MSRVLTVRCNCPKICEQELTVHKRGEQVCLWLAVQGTMLLDRDDACRLRDWLDRFIKQP